VNSKELAELDLAVATAVGLPGASLVGIRDNLVCRYNAGGKRATYKPTRDGGIALELLEKFELTLRPASAVNKNAGAKWACGVGLGLRRGETPAIAICMAVAALRRPEKRK
jgi:hypothetical protein